MQEVTALIIAIVFVGLVFPKIVKNMPLFYGALALALIVVLLESLGRAVGSEGLYRFLSLISGVLDVTAIILLVMGTGGQTFGQLAGEMGRGFEVVRQSAAPQQSAAASITPATPGVAPSAAAPATPPKARTIAMPPKKPQGDSSIPMD